MTADNSKDLPNNNKSNNSGNSETVNSKERLLPLVESNDFDQLVKERVKVLCYLSWFS